MDCPFCIWPSMAVTTTPGMDSIGNEFFHGKCKVCDCEAVFFRKAET